MNVRVTIDLPAEMLSELQALLTGNLPSIHDLEREPVPVPEEPAVVAAPKSVKSVEPERPRETTKNDKPRPKTVNKEMIRARGIEITKAGKQDQLAAVFKQFGAANLRSVKEEDYAAVYEMLEAI